MPSPTSKNKPAKYGLAFEAIGTRWQITTDRALDAVTTRQINDRIARFDHDYSRFKPDSWLRQVGLTPGVYDMPADAQPLFDLYQQLYQLTGGAMTPLIGQMLAQAGYDEQYSLTPKTVTPLPSWDTAMKYAFPKLTVTQSILLDVGAAGKGYLVDIICDILSLTGNREFVVNAGGDIRQVSAAKRFEQIGLEHPSKLDEAIGIATLQNQSLCGSAGNRRAWAGYNHIIDPRSLSSPNTIAAIWVSAATTVLADGLTTALYFCEPQKLAQSFTFEYAMLHADGSLRYSRNFPAQFFSTD